MIAKSSVRDALSNYVSSNPEFQRFHFDDLGKAFEELKSKNIKHPDFNKYKNLIEKNSKNKKNSALQDKVNYEEFFNAIMDETRQFYADAFSEFILFRSDMHDSTYFRNIISRKELAREIDYSKHRDHAAHTLNNYLLGWYFYTNCTEIRNKINSKINFLRNRLNAGFFNETEFFGHTWVNVSLMHDIGYIFEGTLASLSSETSGDFIRRSAGVVHNYFFHRFWFESKLDISSIKHTLKTSLDFSIENFNDAKTMIQLGDLLTTLPDIDQIKDSSTVIKAIISDRLKFVDSFELWRIFSEELFGDTMDKKRTQRIENLKTAYYEMMYKGLGDNGARIIDHGVASGLLLLLYHSYFFTIYFQLKNERKSSRTTLLPEDHEDFEELKKFVVDILPFQHFKYHSEWFFAGILWATSAAALHNIQQKEAKEYFQSIEDDGKLTIDEDPLAYLGILVDVIQEWDRQRVFPGDTFVGKLPVQSVDVEIISRNFSIDEIKKAANYSVKTPATINPGNKIALIFPKKEHIDTIGNDLKKALIDSWKYVLVFDKSAGIN